MDQATLDLALAIAVAQGVPLVTAKAALAAAFPQPAPNPGGGLIVGHDGSKTEIVINADGTQTTTPLAKGF